VQRGRDEEALAIMRRVGGEEHAAGEYRQIKASLTAHAAGEGAAFGELFSRRMRFVMFIGLVIAFFQQVSGINAILYYAPMIFEMAGGGKESAFRQAVILGLVNFGMTIVSMFLIDRLGRKPLLLIGSLLMAVSLLTASFAFWQARYELTSDALARLSASVAAQAGDANAVARARADAAAMSQVLGKVADETFTEETAFFGRIKEETARLVRQEVEGVLVRGEASPDAALIRARAEVKGGSSAVGEVAREITEMRYSGYKDRILRSTITVNAGLVLVALLGFIAGFAISLGPVMWALLSEIFPNRLRGLAISVAGTWNAITSFTVATLFPSQLEGLGSAVTYLIYGLFMVACVLFVLKWIPETKGKTLEEIERDLVGA
jgi:MFS family permease